MSSLADLEIQYQRLVAERNALGDRYEAGELNVLPQIKDLNTRIQAVLAQIDSGIEVFEQFGRRSPRRSGCQGRPR